MAQHSGICSQLAPSIATYWFWDLKQKLFMLLCFTFLNHVTVTVRMATLYEVILRVIHVKWLKLSPQQVRAIIIF